MDVKKAFAFRALCDVMVIGAQWNINMSWAWNTKRVWQKHQAIYYFRFLLWHHLDLTHLFWDERLFFWPNVIPKIFISYRNMIFDNSKIFFFLNVNGSIQFDFKKFGLSVIGSLKTEITRLYWFSCFLKGPTSFNTFNIQMSVDMPFNNQITVILRPCLPHVCHYSLYSECRSIDSLKSDSSSNSENSVDCFPILNTNAHSATLIIRFDFERTMRNLRKGWA